MENEIVLSSRVRLARNYQDLPFDLTKSPEEAAGCISRTVNALALSGMGDAFHLIRLADIGVQQQQQLVENHRISRDLMRNPATSAVLLDDAGVVSVMIGEEDHLRIQAVRPGLDLLSAAAAVFRVDDALSRQIDFAFDATLGYLTSCPTNTGTGMRASLMMHLPLLTLYKQMGSVGQIVAKVGLNIHGVYGEGAEALGNVYVVSNQATLGRTEQEIISAVTAVGHQLSDMERALRQKALSDYRAATEDAIYRGWGILKHARLMTLKEFYVHWSAVRVGAALGMIPVSLTDWDELLDVVQDANLQAEAERRLEGTELAEYRAKFIRRRLMQLIRKGGK